MAIRIHSRYLDKYFILSIAIIFIVMLISIALFVYSFLSWNNLINSEMTLHGNIMDFQLELAEGHLWFEKMLIETAQSDGRDEQKQDEMIEKVWGYFDKAKLDLSNTIESEKNSSFFDAKLLNNLTHLQTSLNELSALAIKRWAERTESGIGSPIAQTFDNIFDMILSDAKKAEELLQSHIDEVMKKYTTNYQIFLSAWIAMVLLALAFLIIINKKRLTAERTLIETNEKLITTNEKLAATNEELIATNEELESANEELNAANEELEATSEELEVSNEELNATNEELHATNEELIASNEELDASNRELKSANDELALVNEALNSEIDKRVLAEQVLNKTVNDLERAKKSLFDEKNKISAILSSIGDGISIQDKDFNITFINDYISQLFGSDIIGRKCYEIYERREHICDGCPMEIAMATGNTTRAIRSGYDINNNEIHVHNTASAIRDENGDIIGGIEVSKDITMQVNVEKEQASLIKELELVNKELNDFAYIVSHDLKAPLRAVSSLANWISTDYASKLDDEGREKLTLLISRVKRMHNLINSILEYSKAGGLKEDIKEINLNEFIPEIIGAIEPPANINIRIENKLPVITCMPTRVEHIFHNLIDNAIKFMDKPEGNISISSSDDGKFWKFCVKDNGPGIEEKDIERIFMIFQTRITTTDSDSTGIGLTIVKKMVELCGGKIWVESEVGKGSAFWFTISKK